MSSTDEGFYDLRALSSQLAARGVPTQYEILKGEPVLIVLEGGRKTSAALSKIFPVVKKGYEKNLLIFLSAPLDRPQDDYMSLEEEVQSHWTRSLGVTLLRGKVTLSVAGARPGTRRLKDVPVYVIMGRAVPERPTALAAALPVKLPGTYLEEHLTSVEMASLATR